ncbi:MAG TPA: hypothetical protein DCO79_10890, partial [Spirochaeta sp.]|nr:hypothetical protein [Spirochaeta sp.]
MKRSFIDVFNILGFIVVLAVAAFAFYSLFIDKPFFKAASYFDNESEGEILNEGESSGTYRTENPVSMVEIGNISGSIEVEGWENDWVRLDYVKRGPGRHPE